MELTNHKQTFLYNKVHDKTIQENIVENEEHEYVVVDMSSWAMK